LRRRRNSPVRKRPLKPSSTTVAASGSHLFNISPEMAHASSQESGGHCDGSSLRCHADSNLQDPLRQRLTWGISCCEHLCVQLGRRRGRLVAFSSCTRALASRTTSPPHTIVSATGPGREVPPARGADQRLCGCRFSGPEGNSDRGENMRTKTHPPFDDNTEPPN